MPLTWNQHSLDKMAGLHPDLVKVLQKFATITQIDCVIAQGVRTREYQYGLWRNSHEIDGSIIAGADWKTNCNGTPVGETSPEGSAGTGLSNHQGGHAVDIAVIIDGEANWDIQHYTALAGDMESAAAAVQIPIVWGGSWLPPKTDSDHWELNRAFYPTA